MKAALVLILCASPARAAQNPPGDSASQRRRPDLADMSLEELMNVRVTVTSVAGKEERLFDSPAAVTVVTAQAIGRSGLTTLPELLRTVPGLTVARINSSEWAITSRGFNDQYATKLLVLVDGRTIYTPMFSGVYWNANDILLEDIERIEVIRGPGAALWGANAVNGVINIITKDAADTRGGLVAATYGTEERPAASLRYGARLGQSTSYRVYLKHADRNGVLDRTDEDPADDWRSTRVGLRVDDHRSDRDHVSAQAEYYRASVGEHFEALSLTSPMLVHTYPVHDNGGGHALVRWRRQYSESSSLTVQSYYDRFRQWDGDTVESRDTWDIDVRRQQRVRARHDVLWGVGYRNSSDSLPSTFYLTFFPAEQRTSLYTAFLQDEVTLLPERLALTLGAKLEHNDFTGYEVQPSARLSWKAETRQFAWAAVSRAVRTPGRFHFDSRLNVSVSQAPNAPPFLVSLISSPTAGSEELVAYEAGYRFEATRRWSIDLATYYNDDDKVFAYVPGTVTFESDPAPPHLLLPLYQTNLLHGHSYGGEVSTRWAVTESWQLSAGYSRLRVQLQPTNTAAAKDPRAQWQMRSDLDLPHGLQVNAAAYYMGRIVSPLNDVVVPLDSYLRVDTSVHWRLSRPHLELVVQGQNLLDPRHAEFGSFKTSTLGEIPRTVGVRLTWAF